MTPLCAREKHSIRNDLPLFASPAPLARGFLVMGVEVTQPQALGVVQNKEGHSPTPWADLTFLKDQDAQRFTFPGSKQFFFLK